MSRSSVQRAVLTRSPGLTSEVLIPSLQELQLVLVYHLLDLAQFNRAEPEVAGKRNWGKPELGRLIISIHVHVRWLVGLVTVEVEPVRPPLRKSHRVARPGGSGLASGPNLSS